ncbi:MAG: tetratricopeptide repeat protein [Alphaproteobacteria bacterium]
MTNPLTLKNPIDLAIFYNKRGVEEYKLGEYQKSIEYFYIAIELNPKYAEAYHNRGFTNKALKQDEKAQEDFGEAKELKNKNLISGISLRNLPI